MDVQCLNEIHHISITLSTIGYRLSDLGYVNCSVCRILWHLAVKLQITTNWTNFLLNFLGFSKVWLCVNSWAPLQWPYNQLVLWMSSAHVSLSNRCLKLMAPLCGGGLTSHYGRKRVQVCTSFIRTRMWFLPVWVTHTHSGEAEVQGAVPSALTSDSVLPNIPKGLCIPVIQSSLCLCKFSYSCIEVQGISHTKQHDLTLQEQYFSTFIIWVSVNLKKTFCELLHHIFCTHRNCWV